MIFVAVFLLLGFLNMKNFIISQKSQYLLFCFFFFFSLLFYSFSSSYGLRIIRSSAEKSLTDEDLLKEKEEKEKEIEKDSKDYLSKEITVTPTVTPEIQTNKLFRIKNLSIKNVSARSVKIYWRSDVETKFKLVYGLKNTKRKFSVNSSKFYLEHDATLRNLLPNNSYRFVIYSKVRKGRFIASKEYSFKTLAKKPNEVTPTATKTATPIITTPSTTPQPTSTPQPTAVNTSTPTTSPTISGRCQASSAIGIPTYNSILIDSSNTHQTIRGWEANAQSGHSFPDFSKYQTELLDRTVNELGITRLRVEIPSGVENPVDSYALYKSGQITEREWVNRSYDIINDDANPNNINLAGFKFSSVDDVVEKVVLPLKQRLQAKGKNLYINLNYVDFRDSTFEHRNNPQEYAELMLAAFQHLQSKYGLVPNGIEIVLEPDNTPWRGNHIGDVIVATAQRLQANGFQIPDFIAPSTTNSANAVPYFNAIAQVPGAIQLVKELSYHRYDGSSANLSAIKTKASQHGITSSMLELIAANVYTLHEDLTVANASAWQQFALAFPGINDDGSAYFSIDANTSTPSVNMGSRTKQLRQYFYYINPGAIRIDANSNNGDLLPVAFINPDCKYVVVVSRFNGGAINVLGLPQGRYGISYSSASRFNVTVPDITITNGEILTANLPDSVPNTVTIFQK